MWQCRGDRLDTLRALLNEDSISSADSRPLRKNSRYVALQNALLWKDEENPSRCDITTQENSAMRMKRLEIRACPSKGSRMLLMVRAQMLETIVPDLRAQAVISSQERF